MIVIMQIENIKIGKATKTQIMYYFAIVKVKKLQKLHYYAVTRMYVHM